MPDGITTVADEFSPTKPSLAIAARIAAREGTSPESLSPPLYSVIDPEALDSLFDASASGRPDPRGQVTFTYCGYEVCVDSGGEITVSDAPRASSSGSERSDGSQSQHAD
ncbi:HalOD1 output domain-containing protein [Saliphagus sp. GCM10025334]